MSGTDKRRAPRRKHDSVLELYDQDGQLITGIGRLVDFSRVGACFTSSKRLAVGDRLRARLRLLKEGPLDVDAQVVWTRKRQNSVLYGIEFKTVKSVRS